MKQDIKKYIIEIEARVNWVRKRINLNNFLNILFRGLYYSVLAACFFALIVKVYPSEIDIMLILAALMGSAAIASIIQSFIKRISITEAAQILDSKTGLKERISSALMLKDYDREFVSALVEDAWINLNRSDIKKEFRIKSPLFLKKLFFFTLIFTSVVFFMPQFNILFDKKEEEKKKRDRIMTTNNIKKMQKKTQEIKKNIEISKNEELAKLFANIDDLTKDIDPNAKAPKDISKEFSKIKDDIKAQREKLEENMKSMQNFQMPEDAKFTQDFSKAVENMDFKKAANEMQKLAEKLKSGQMSQQDQQRLAKELSKLADNMKQTNPNMAQNLEKMAQTLQKASESQTQQTSQQQNQSQSSSDKGNQQEQNQSSSQQCNNGQTGKDNPNGQQMPKNGAQGQQMNMGKMDQKTLNDLSNQMEALQGNLSEMNEVAQQMSALDSLENDMEARQAAELADGSYLGSGEGNNGAGGEGNGPGTGGRGQGKGGKVPFNPDAQMEFKDTKIDAPKSAGKIIGVFKVDGKAEKGESTVAFKELFVEYKQQAEDTIEKDVIPVTYKNYVRTYFDSINPQNSSSEKQDTPPEDKKSGTVDVK